MLLDADPQMTAARWADRRNEANLPVVHSAQKTGDIYHFAKDMAARYDAVVIDAGSQRTKTDRREC